MSGEARPLRTLGVVGVGTMGAGIAQIAAAAGVEAVVHDPVEGAVARGLDGIRAALTRGAERGRMTAADADAAAARLRAAVQLQDLAGCDVVIEAAPESLDLKREIFAALAAVCGPDTLLATNTSSIPIAAVANGTPHPERVIGLHFFNPVPAMRLLEVIPARQTAPWALAAGVAAGERLGKDVIVARDGPGFLVNRCGRPFYTEALRLVQERVATPEQVDRICRLGGGFRMGPFELMDLVGIDVGYAVARSFMELSFGEPRWKPNPLQAGLVAAGHLGRKTGRGWYDYEHGPHRPDDAPPPEPGAAEPARVAVLGDGPVARRLRRDAAAAGHDLVDAGATVTIVADGADDEARPHDGVEVRLCATRSLVGQGRPDAIGFQLLAEPAEARLIELVRTPRSHDGAATTAERLFRSLGLHVEWVGDAPGGVLGRIVAQVVNEACFAVGEGVGTAADVDAGTQLGLNYPRGPVAWGAALGWSRVLGMVDGLWHERREDRYRPAPRLQAAAVLGALEDG